MKIEIEPKVHHNHEITIKLKVEVSAISGSVSGGTANNPAQPIIGTREMQQRDPPGGRRDQHDGGAHPEGGRGPP